MTLVRARLATVILLTASAAGCGRTVDDPKLTPAAESTLDGGSDSTPMSRISRETASNDKLNPHLITLLSAVSSSARISVTVTFKSVGDPAPSLIGMTPSSASNIPSTAELAYRAARLTQNSNLVAEFHGLYDATALAHCLLIRCIDFTIPATHIASVAQRPDVLYIDPFTSDDPPPQDGCPPGNCVPLLHVADFMNSAPLRALRLIDVRTALLDTAISPTHSLLDKNSSIRYVGRLNCAIQNCYLEDGDPLGLDHGTKAATILVGGDERGQDYEGLTDFTLDALQVYNCTSQPCTPDDLLTTTADHQLARMSIEYAALRLGSRVIVVETQFKDSYQVQETANEAFRIGAVVIAPTGNRAAGASTTVRVPARGRNVIGVGVEQLIETGGKYGYERQPGNSHRFAPTGSSRKPEILGITEACGGIGAAGLEDCLNAFGGTSGAAVTAAGAATLLRGWLAGDGSEEPAYTYVHLLMAGRYAATPDLDAAEFDKVGAGGICLPDVPFINGAYWRNQVRIARGESRQIAKLQLDRQIGNGHEAELDVAAWWPDTLDNKMSMKLTSPTGCVRTIQDPGSAFLKMKVSNVDGLTVDTISQASRLEMGGWTLSLHNEGDSATVYWAATAHSVSAFCGAKAFPKGYASTKPDPGQPCSD